MHFCRTCQLVLLFQDEWLRQGAGPGTGYHARRRLFRDILFGLGDRLTADFTTQRKHSPKIFSGPLIIPQSGA